jgi:uncharacterized secreted protein with C-terminal beta-propeller domain
MMRPLWARFISTDRFSQPASRRVCKSKRNRLGLEQLENRLFLNADNPLVASPLPIGQDALQAVAAISSSTNNTTNAPWQRFQSTEDLEAWLVEAAVARWEHLFAQTPFSGIIYCGDIGLDNFVTLSTASRITANLSTTSNLTIEGQFAANYSTTNLQVAGVDEADLVETDGEFLYIISGNDLVIVEAGDGDDFRVASRVHLQERPTGMYLSGNRLTLVSTGDSASEIRVNPGIQVSLPWLILPGDFSTSNTTTTVTVLDIADRDSPTLVQKTEFDGQLVTSRVVDGELRLVLSSHLDFPRPIIFGSTENEAGRYETQEEYLARVRDQLVSLAQPHMRELNADGNVTSETALFEPEELYRPDSLADGYVTTIATFDLMGDDPGVVATANMISGNAATVYCTDDSVYVFAQEAVGPDTDIWKFSLDSQTHSVDLVAKGNFAGTC